MAAQLRAGEPSAKPTISSPPVHLCDAIHSLAVHNGVARVMFTRLTADGAPLPALELLLPVVALPQLIETLQKAL